MGLSHWAPCTKRPGSPGTSPSRCRSLACSRWSSDAHHGVSDAADLRSDVLRVDLPSDEFKVLRRVAPAEVVHPSPHTRVDHFAHDLLHRDVQVVAECVTERAQEPGALLLLGPAQGHLLRWVLPCGFPLEGVSQEVDGIARADVHDSGLLFVDGEVELRKFFPQAPLDRRCPVPCAGVAVHQHDQIIGEAGVLLRFRTALASSSPGHVQASGRCR